MTDAFHDPRGGRPAVATLSAAVALLALAGCGGGDAAPGIDAAAAPQASGAKAAALHATPPSNDPDRRARALLAQMTQDEKLLLVHGAGFPAFFGGRVSIRLPAARFAVWNGGWRVPAGAATLRIGGSSRDAGAAAATLRLRAQPVDHAR